MIYIIYIYIYLVGGFGRKMLVFQYYPIYYGKYDGISKVNHHLVGGLEHFDYFSISCMGCHPSHWLSLIFFKMFFQPPTRITCRPQNQQVPDVHPKQPFFSRILSVLKSQLIQISKRNIISVPEIWFWAIFSMMFQQHRCFLLDWTYHIFPNGFWRNRKERKVDRWLDFWISGWWLHGHCGAEARGEKLERPVMGSSSVNDSLWLWRLQFANLNMAHRNSGFTNLPFFTHWTWWFSIVM